MQKGLKTVGEKKQTLKRGNFTLGSSGVVAEVRQRAAVHSIVCICGVEAPQEITDMSEVKTSIAH